ncbi:MAG: hypothetical protein M3R24_03430 [Chloroflexota bacterium]|nr:hypothetical protein [Chloroflexota bacterium]
MDTETLSTLLSVLGGFLLAVGWETWKQSRAERGERRRVRTILGQEVAYNVAFLTHIRDELKAATEDHKGNPTAVIGQAYSSALSSNVWESQIQHLPSALSEAEITATFRFYSHLCGVVTALDEYHYRRPTTNNPITSMSFVHSRIEMVKERVELALDAAPAITT